MSMIVESLLEKPIYNSFKVTDWLYAGEYPGDKGVDTAKDKIEQCLKFGITHFIDLTEVGELVPYRSMVEGVAHYKRFPIVDVSILGFVYGMNYENAISNLRRLFMDCPKSARRVIPETYAQLDFVRRFIEFECNK